MKKLFQDIWVNNQKAVIIILVLLVLFVILLIANIKKGKIITKPELIANTSSELIKEETYEGLKFNNISLISKDGYSTFTADVTNTSSETSNIQNVNIVLKDKKGNTIVTLLGNIGQSLKANETKTITASTKGELTGVVSKTITKSDY
jgi:hypothetical protein